MSEGRRRAGADFARRHSFLIDPAGVVRKVYEVTDVATHPQQVLDDVTALRVIALKG